MGTAFLIKHIAARHRHNQFDKRGCIGIYAVHFDQLIYRSIDYAGYTAESAHKLVSYFIRIFSWNAVKQKHFHYFMRRCVLIKAVFQKLFSHSLTMPAVNILFHLHIPFGY